MREYKNIMVPVDGSMNSELALRKAIATAQRNHAHLDIVTVIQSTRFLDIYGHMGSNMQDVEIAYQKAQDYMQMLKDRIASKYGFTAVTPHVAAGNPKVLVATELPNEFQSDMIIMGATGQNAMQRVMLGSVADHTIRSAKVDVLLVRTNLDNVPFHNIKK